MTSKIEHFKKTVWDYYRAHRREMPWRNTTNPYHIFISEVMLQQTQVNRIIPKYEEWLKPFPDFESLAGASLESVLRAWQGIGYNRRALHLKKAAQIIVQDFNGKLPNNPIVLDSLPGIGEATAGSIVVYAFNKPLVFIETNVRRIYIHHFFADRDEITDKELYPIVDRTLDNENPREWYYALMDYGTYLAKLGDNPNRRSKHYVRQSKFEGSDRQIRAKIVKEILNKGSMTTEEINESINDDRVAGILTSLLKENFLVRDKDEYKIYSSS